MGMKKIQVWFAGPEADDRGNGPESNWAKHNYWPKEFDADNGEWYRRHPNFESYGVFPPEFNPPGEIIGNVRVSLCLEAAQLQNIDILKLSVISKTFS